MKLESGNDHVPLSPSGVGKRLSSRLLNVGGCSPVLFETPQLSKRVLPFSALKCCVDDGVECAGSPVRENKSSPPPSVVLTPIRRKEDHGNSNSEVCGHFSPVSVAFEALKNRFAEQSIFEREKERILGLEVELEESLLKVVEETATHNDHHHNAPEMANEGKPPKEESEEKAQIVRKRRLSESSLFIDSVRRTNWRQLSTYAKTKQTPQRASHQHQDMNETNLLINQILMGENNNNNNNNNKKKKKKRKTIFKRKRVLINKKKKKKKKVLCRSQSVPPSRCPLYRNIRPKVSSFRTPKILKNSSSSSININNRKKKKKKKKKNLRSKSTFLPRKKQPIQRRTHINNNKCSRRGKRLNRSFDAFVNLKRRTKAVESRYSVFFSSAKKKNGKRKHLFVGNPKKNVQQLQRNIKKSRSHFQKLLVFAHNNEKKTQKENEKEHNNNKRRRKRIINNLNKRKQRLLRSSSSSSLSPFHAVPLTFINKNKKKKLPTDVHTILREITTENGQQKIIEVKNKYKIENKWRF